MSEMRLVSGQQPLVLEAMAETLGSLRAQVARNGTSERTDLIDEELAALCSLVAAAANPAAMASVQAALQRIGDDLPAACL